MTTFYVERRGAEWSAERCHAGDQLHKCGTPPDFHLYLDAPCEESAIARAGGPPVSPEVARRNIRAAFAEIAAAFDDDDE